ncbi:MAG: M20/M25/M40 family metallo-hydrolase [Candidatus Odinarchaeota archaeon]
MNEYIREVMGNIWTSPDIYKHLYHLCDGIGPRPAGSETAREASGYIRKEFEKYGLTVSRHSFSHQGWQIDESELLIENKCFPSNVFTFSGNGELSGDIYILQSPSEKTFEHARFDGMILVVQPSKQVHGGMGRKAMVKAAIEGGALAYVEITGDPGGIIATGSISDEGTVKIPALSVSYETGALLARKKKYSSGEMVLKVKGHEISLESENVIGDLQADSEAVIISGAHYDTYAIGPGAFDNGTGVATILGIAEAVTKSNLKKELPVSLKFIAFTSEELGLLGSEAYVKDFIDSGKVANTRLMMNYDCTAITGGVRGAFTSNDMKLNQHIVNLVRDHGFDVRMSLRPPHQTDGFPFFKRKIPTFGLAQFKSPSYMHTAYDTPEKVSEDSLKNSTAIAGAILANLMSKDQRKNTS